MSRACGFWIPYRCVAPICEDTDTVPQLILQRRAHSSHTFKKTKQTKENTALIQAVQWGRSQRAPSVQLEDGPDFHLLVHPHHTGTCSCMYGGPCSLSCKEQHVDLPSAPPPAFSLQILKASAGEAAHTHPKSFPLLRSVFDLALQAFVNVCLTSSFLVAQLPEQARAVSNLLDAHLRRLPTCCTWTPNPPAPLHHTKFDTACSSLDRPAGARPIPIDPRCVQRRPPDTVSLPILKVSSSGPSLAVAYLKFHQVELPVHQLLHYDRDQSLVVVHLNELPQLRHHIHPTAPLDALIHDLDDVLFLLQVRSELQGADLVVACSKERAGTL